MSLVDYASSSGEEDDEDEQGKSTPVIVSGPETAPVKNEQEGKQDAETKGSTPLLSPSVISRENRNWSSIVYPSAESGPPSSRPAIQLPDAALLFASFSGQSVVGTDHASRVAAAINQNTSRKRDSNGIAAQFTCNKQPRGNSSHTRSESNIPGNLLPPQLRGRSNVVTEDISKLFVNRKGAP